ncbi:MAG: GIY-YIG nuclease family protein [Candidatus Magasanikbacteria bacterium]
MNTKIAQQLKNLPDAPGVYLFFNSKKELIYVGKASSLKNRVRGYFKELDSRLRGNDKSGLSRPIEEMIHEVMNFKTEETDSALEAAILEGKYIKENRPKYNIDWRDDKSWNYIVITKDKFPRVLTIRQHELKNGGGIPPLATLGRNDKRLRGNDKYKYVFGPYPGLNTKEALRLLRKIFLFSTCEPNAKRPCFSYQIGQCLGVCTGEISPKDYSAKVIRPLCLFLGGKKKILMKKTEKEMNMAAKLENFEEASRLRNQLRHLQKIQDVALLNDSFLRDITKRNSLAGRNDMRIEGYDISNLGSSNKVGSMVVFDEVGPVKNQYRKFKIKTVVGQSDVDCLAEVLERRIKHAEWILPNIFLIDGGLPQVNKTKSVLRRAGINTPIVGIAKGAKRKRNDFFVVTESLEIKNWIKENKELLIRVRDEAHRFAIKFNRVQRKI